LSSAMCGLEGSMTLAIEVKYASLKPILDERARHLREAVEARAIGRGGITRVSEVTGLSRVTVRAGLKEISLVHPATVGETRAGRIRRPGGGRKPLVNHDPELLRNLVCLVDPAIRAEPQSPLRWTCKTADRLAGELRARRHTVRERTANRLLHSMGYSLQATRKAIEGSQHPDREAQFQHISRRV
jgi:hypothetical protein